MNSAAALYKKEIYNYYKDYIKVKYFIKHNFIIFGLNINHIIDHLQEKLFKDFLEDKNDIANNYQVEIKINSLILLFYCVILNIYSLVFIFSYWNYEYTSGYINSLLNQ